MVVRAPGDSGYDPATGWPPDDSTGVGWQNDVELPGKFPFRWGNTDLPGQFRGGGQGFGWGDTTLPDNFGPGGFRGSPKLVANPAGPPPGVSLSGPGGSSAAVPGDVIPPTNSTIPNNKSVGAFTGGTSTENGGPRIGTAVDAEPYWRDPKWASSAHIDPTTGKPEMLTGPGGLVEKTRGSINPFGFIGGGNPYWRGAIAAGGVLTPSPAETGEFNPAMVAGRPEAPMGGVHGVPAAAAPSQPPARPYTPTPATAYPAAPMPARPVTPTPRAAAPRAAAPPPSAFTLIDRPNADVAGGARGRQSVPRISALDLSKLFARQQ